MRASKARSISVGQTVSQVSSVLQFQSSQSDQPLCAAAAGCCWFWAAVGCWLLPLLLLLLASFCFGMLFPFSFPLLVLFLSLPPQSFSTSHTAATGFVGRKEKWQKGRFFPNKCVCGGQRQVVGKKAHTRKKEKWYVVRGCNHQNFFWKKNPHTLPIHFS
jgi:hypothetical protein